MKIAMLMDTWKPIWAGGQIHVWETCKRLVKDYGCEIDLFVMNLKGNEDDKKECFYNDKLSVFKVGNPSDFNFASRLKWCYDVCRFVKRIHKERDYDLIHAHSDLAAMPGKLLSILMKKPIILTVHVSSFFWKGNKNPLKYFEKLLQVYIKYDWVLAVGSYLFDYPLRTKNKLFIGNGTSFKIKEDLDKRNKNQILFAGRIHKQKGVDFLINSLKFVKSDFKLKIVGDGELKKDMIDLAENLNLDKKIYFVGWVDHSKIKSFYDESKIFILPSRFEGFGIVLLEALASGTIPIATKSGGPTDIIKNGENGFLVNFGEEKRLASLIDKIFKMDKESLKKIRENGFKTIRKFTWGKVAHKIFKTYSEVLIK